MHKPPYKLIELRTIIAENEQIINALENKLAKTPEEHVNMDLLRIKTENLNDTYWTLLHKLVEETEV